MNFFNIEVKKSKRSWLAFAMPKDISTCKDFIQKHIITTNHSCMYRIRRTNDKCKITTRLRKCIVTPKKESQYQRGIESNRIFKQIA